MSFSRAKKDFPSQISSFKSEDGNVRVFTPPLQNGGSHVKTTVNTLQQLDDFLVTKLGIRSSKYVKPDDW